MNATSLGTPSNPLHVAVVGSGPSGFYAAEALLRSGRSVHINMLERLPAPFGLVRYGVAPDHPRLKAPTLVYDRIAHHPLFAFLGNVTVGRDVMVDDLRATHHAIVFATGAASDRRLNIPGEDLPGSHSATEFVNWYNGHPNYKESAFDLSTDVAVIIGQGNVAIDLCRILAKTIDELRDTDISERALECLASSQIRDIYIVGRRGPAQSRFAPEELKELGQLSGCTPIVKSADIQLNPASGVETANKMNRFGARNLQLLTEFALRKGSSQNKRCHFRFLLSPIRIHGAERVEYVTFERNVLDGAPFAQVAVGTGEKLGLNCGLVLRSIGYRGVEIPGVPFDEASCIFPNRDGRLLDKGHVIPALYATGWIKRGPNGTIGTNRADSVATVAALLEDLSKLEGAPKSSYAGLRALLADRGVRIVSYADWLKIDAVEIERGQAKGKTREKVTSLDEMLAVAQPP